MKSLHASVRHARGLSDQGLTVVRRLQECPSPPRRQTHGCFLCTGSRLHILTVVSSDADAMIRGLMGEVARSLISCHFVNGRANVLGQSVAYTSMTHQCLYVPLAISPGKREEAHVTNRIDLACHYIVDLHFGIPASYTEKWLVRPLLLGPATRTIESILLQYISIVVAVRACHVNLHLHP